jgi:hypothetical protein
MRRAAFPWVIVATAVVCMLPLAHAARVGERAPDFFVMDMNGKTQKLSDYAGKFVVLEWSNRGCPCYSIPGHAGSPLLCEDHAADDCD